MNASPVVWQKKKDGSFRVCAEFKVHGNDKIMTEDYSLPDMETLFHELEGSNFYVKIDLSSAYYQLMLDDAAQEICVINTTLGLKEGKTHPECSSEQSITLSKDWLELYVSRTT